MSRRPTISDGGSTQTPCEQVEQVCDQTAVPKDTGVPKTPGLILPMGLVVLQIAITKQMWGEKYRSTYDAFGTGVSAVYPALASCLYIMMVYYGQRAMKSRDALDDFCKPYMLIYNLYQTVFNAWWVVSVVMQVYTLGAPIFRLPLTKDAAQFDLGLLIWLHYQNKYIEMLDTLFMVLRKKTKQVSFLHCYHHVMLCWAWFFVCKYGCGGESYFGALMNANIHVLMYGYYFLSTIKISVPWKKYLTMMQMGQFIICLSHSIWCCVSGIYPMNLCLLNMWIMLNMLYLFGRFYQQSYKKKNSKSKSSAQTTTTAQDDQKQSKSAKKYVHINGLKYDVTDFARKHPGGKVINYYIDQDATDAYNAFHRTAAAAKLLKTLERTPVSKPTPVPAYLKEFRQLVRKWTDQGLYKVTYTTIAIRLVEIFGLITLSIWGARHSVVAAGILAGFVWTKCGFLQHDAGHLSVTGYTAIDIPLQVLVEGFVKGGSAAWWRNRHNKHHAKPNIHTQDTDLLTLPFLSWDKEHAKKAPKWLIRYQAYYFLPLLCLYVPVFFITTKLFMLRKKRPIEAAVSVIHYATFITAIRMWSGLTALQILSWYLIGYAVQGLYLGFVFSLSHFVMPQMQTPEEGKNIDWVKLQCMTTLNFSSSEVVGWFTGQLNMQIEHHLVPQMPSWNYQYIAKDVIGLCSRHKEINYRALDFWEAVSLNFRTLNEVARYRCAQKD